MYIFITEDWRVINILCFIPHYSIKAQSSQNVNIIYTIVFLVFMNTHKMDVSSQEPLPLQIFIRFLVNNVAKGILEFFLLLRLPSFSFFLILDLLPQCKSIFNLCHICKMGCIWNTQASHTMSMSPFCKMPLESFGSFIGEVATYLAVVTNVKPMKFIKPIWDRFAIPTKRQIFRIVWDF